MNTSSKRQAAQGRHAVVLGGSLAGLLAARVLSDHFDEVTLVAVRHVLLRAVGALSSTHFTSVLAHVLKERKLHENADRNHGRERQVGGRQKVSANRLVS